MKNRLNSHKKKINLESLPLEEGLPLINMEDMDSNFLLNNTGGTDKTAESQPANLGIDTTNDSRSETIEFESYIDERGDSSETQQKTVDANESIKQQESVNQTTVYANSKSETIEFESHIDERGDSSETQQKTVDANESIKQQESVNQTTITEDVILVPSSTETNSASNIVRDKSRSKRRLNKKIYCEFVSDNEDPFLTDGSSSWNDPNNTDLSSDSSAKKKNKKKTKQTKNKKTKEADNTGMANETAKNDDIDIVGEKGKKIKKVNRKKKRKELKGQGKEYIKVNGKIRSKREIKTNPCTGKKCGNNCESITEERRTSLFNHFWSLNSDRQRDWIVNMSRRTAIKRKRSKDSGKRTFSYEYYINENEGRRKICQQFLLNTLDITQTYVYYTLSNSMEGSSKDDLRGKLIPANKTKEATRESVMNFIKKLPALPSHYCRKGTSKLYLPTEFKNQKNLYRIYKEEKTSEGFDYVSEKTFLNIFKTEFNIGFHIPKKDKCVKCIKLDASNTEESKAQKEEHLLEKKASKDRYSSHRELSNNRNDIICTSFDLQKVLNTPHGESMLLYYSRKYAIYNLCFYENGTREGYCYIWGESEGKRGGNEIASIIQKYVHLVDERASVKHLILYSDSCPGQNKNKIVLAALHNALKDAENLMSIQMNYLLPGHTEMSVDSMHSVIEGSIKNTIVWAPSQWATICQLARKDPKPYNVTYLDHTDFQGYDSFADKYYRGNLTGKISKIRVATFKKSKINQMTVKYSMKEDAEEEIIPVIGPLNAKITEQLYSTSLPITKTKYNDLKKLCNDHVIPRMFQKEYLDLPSITAIDMLVETDIEDVM